MNVRSSALKGFPIACRVMCFANSSFKFDQSARILFMYKYFHLYRVYFLSSVTLLISNS